MSAVGLSWNMKLEEGKVVLSGGADKARDNMLFLLNFNYIRRIYLRGFTPNLEWLLQKPTSLLIQLKALILGNLKSKVNTYVPTVIMRGIDVDYSRARKMYLIGVRYNFNEELDAEPQDVVTFI